MHPDTDDDERTPTEVINLLAMAGSVPATMFTVVVVLTYLLQ